MSRVESVAAEGMEGLEATGGEVRPQALYGLMAPLDGLKGIGPRLALALGRLLGKEAPRVRDLLFLAPSGRRDLGLVPRLEEGMEGEGIALQALVLDHRPPPPGTRLPYRVMADAAGTPIEFAFFKGKRPWLERLLPEGAVVSVFGRLARYGGRWQMTHPERLPDDPSTLSDRLYPLIEGLTQTRLRAVMAEALAVLPDLPEWLDRRLVAQDRLPAFKDALAVVHGVADGAESGDADAAARRRLALDELFAMQLSLDMVRRERESRPGRAWLAPGVLEARLKGALPFPLTGAQERAIEAIGRDLAGDGAMMRLLMGDVGSGKTLVALMAMLRVVEAGGQAALMAPTEVLARQHHGGLSELAARIGLEVDILTGQDGVRARRRVLGRIADGTSSLVVGTHALFQERVGFARLGLAVIDEQHRFGVHQRLDLVDKGDAVDLLLMTATPIPRSLVMSLYGDIATSRLDEMPPGRRPVDTRIVQGGRVDEVADGLGRALEAGKRAYWVTPAVEAGEDPNLPAAVERFAWLRGRFGDRVGLVHGRMKAAAKAAAVADFKAGRTQLLVATTVIEVGVDVPEASIIVVDAAERFGLAQLHQLRGRVGRGEEASVCLLLAGARAGAMAQRRLKVLKSTRDGFRIAEEDLRLRGPGEVLGARQSGLPDLVFADLVRDAELLSTARDDARLLLEADPTLAAPRGRAARLALHLFERDEAVRLLRAG